MKELKHVQRQHQATHVKDHGHVAKKTETVAKSAVVADTVVKDSQKLEQAKKAQASAPVLQAEPRGPATRLFDPFTSTDIAGPKLVAPLNDELVKAQPLKGKQVVVLVESQFVPQELADYATRFTAYGADVHFVSRLWNQPQLTFHSRYDNDIVPEIRTMVVNEDISSVDLDSGKVAAVIQSVHTQQRLLYEEHIVSAHDPVEAMRQAPAVQLVKKALENPNVVMGTFGHGAEVLAPLKDLIAGAHMTTSPGSAAHVANTGAVFVEPADPSKWTLHTVTERARGLNLVTAMSILDGGNEAFIDAVAKLAGELRSEQEKGTS